MIDAPYQIKNAATDMSITDYSFMSQICHVLYFILLGFSASTSLSVVSCGLQIIFVGEIMAWTFTENKCSKLKRINSLFLTCLLVYLNVA